MSMNVKAPVATSSCFPTYEFKANFSKDRTATLKVHNKTPTLNKVHTLVIPSSHHSPKPRIIELPEEEIPIMPCSKTMPSTPAMEKQVDRQQKELEIKTIQLPLPQEHLQQEQQVMRSQEIVEAPLFSL